MATVNGVSSTSPDPEPSQPANSTKRKRSTSSEPQPVNGVSAATAADKKSPVNGLHQRASIADIVTLLKSYDPDPSLFDIQLPIDDLDTSSEPAAKRTKLTQPASKTTTISTKLQDNAYSSVKQLATDLNVACTRFEPQNALSNGTDAAVNRNNVKIAKGNEILAFKKILQRCVMQEEEQAEESPEAQDDEDDKSEHDTDEKTEESTKKRRLSLKDDATSDRRTSLAIFANASGPKQLFSSLQRPVKVGAKSSATIDSGVDVNVGLKTDGLPNIISTISIAEKQLSPSAQNKKATTFKDAYPPPATSAFKLHPPNKARQASSNTLTWEYPEPHPISDKNKLPIWTTMDMKTGQWLGYGGDDSIQEIISPVEKRRQRERALSTGEAREKPSEQRQKAIQQSKEDALFRNAFSSFGPCRDNSEAVVPEETKTQIWWHKHGQQKFEHAIFIDPALTEGSEVEEINGDATLLDEESLKDTVDNWKTDEIEFGQKSADDKDTEEILREVSDLIETLYSYQRIRHASRPSSSRMATGTSTDPIETATTPGDAEREVYNTLRMQLLLLVQSLPPYAVAKLNGDQLAELNIPRTLVVETKDYAGNMEDDALQQISKTAALASASGSRGATGHGYGNYGHANHYSRTPTQATPSRHSNSYATPATLGHAQSYGRNSFSAHRPSSSSFGGYNASTYRPSSNSAQQYGQHSARPSFGSSQQPQYSPQRPQYAQHNQGYGTPTQSTFNATSHNSSYSNFAQRQSSTPGMYNSNSFNLNASSTPQPPNSSGFQAPASVVAQQKLAAQMAQPAGRSAQSGTPGTPGTSFAPHSTATMQQQKGFATPTHG